MADYLGKKGQVGDTDDRGANMSQRAERYGEWLDEIGENIHYGDHILNIGTSIVMDWIIDDGGNQTCKKRSNLSAQFQIEDIDKTFFLRNTRRSVWHTLLTESMATCALQPLREVRKQGSFR